MSDVLTFENSVNFHGVFSYVSIRRPKPRSLVSPIRMPVPAQPKIRAAKLSVTSRSGAGNDSKAHKCDQGGPIIPDASIS